MRSILSGAATQASLVSLLLVQSIQAKPTISPSAAEGQFRWVDNVETTKTPALNLDFPDPSVVEGMDRWYAFATAGSNGGYHKLVQVAQAPGPAGPWQYLNIDLFGGYAGPWTNNRDIWAPDVRMVDDGTYVMYYTAAMAKDPSMHCLGVATCNELPGPWRVSDTYWHCDEDRGGTIDASGFKDTDGSRYVAYKIDGNSKGNGGECDNSVAPIHSTPIMLQKVAGDGYTKIGDPVQILDRTDADGPLVEAPNIVKSSDGRYVMFYSSHCYTSPQYNVHYAIADNVWGPYTRANEPFLESNMFGLQAPGGGTSTVRGSDFEDIMVFHADCPEFKGGSNRCMYVSNFTETGNSLVVNP